MLICCETICTRTIGNKRFPDEPETLLGDLACYLTSFELDVCQVAANFPSFAVQHRKPWGFARIISFGPTEFFFFLTLLILLILLYPIQCLLVRFTVPPSWIHVAPPWLAWFFKVLVPTFGHCKYLFWALRMADTGEVIDRVNASDANREEISNG